MIEEPDLHDTVPIPISKAQLKYAQEEAKLWKELVISSENANINLARVVEMVEQFASAGLPSDEAQLDQEEDPSISERSAKLEEQSGLMAESLVRRAKPPTTLTYAESRLILEAMGIPCIESSIPYEAEALASSLVLHGFADFVGSEDTVSRSSLCANSALIVVTWFSVGCSRVQRSLIAQHNKPEGTSASNPTFRGNGFGLVARCLCRRSNLNGDRLCPAS